MSEGGREQPEQVDGQAGGAPDGQAGGAPDVASGEGTVVRRRRAPRYRAFGVTGAVLGALAGLALALTQEAGDAYSMPTIVGYFATSLGMIGALLGLGVAVLSERRR